MIGRGTRITWRTGRNAVWGIYKSIPLFVNLLPLFPHIHKRMAQVIVVGGGLAGLSAAHTLLERGANVLLLDKQGSAFFSFNLIQI
jgi:FAD binding domain